VTVDSVAIVVVVVSFVPSVIIMVVKGLDKVREDIGEVWTSPGVVDGVTRAEEEEPVVDDRLLFIVETLTINKVPGTSCPE